ncbi:UDP-3-O-(3-hydroxymyristoyl)glucosamine N-acyltransferase [Thiotrichales bacterium 19S9-12]|nr:UDP-3-O-(3-hydroxymyristoyl)glucosamine N-acyltransferase [Thiotrichales bacterium 19S9-11]MCF6812183.1 UDP-3-O-(3-hydroxymyristoyl)glucosamine N-acyltransferase [Thiotrichales bacterium 19S9-12]
MSVSYSLSELAVQLGGTLKGDPSATVQRISTLKGAEKGCLSFLANPKYINDLKNTNATAVLVTSDAAEICPVDAIILKDPYFAFAKVAELFDKAPKLGNGIHPSAVIDPTAEVNESAKIGANVVIGAHTVIDSDVSIWANTIISSHCHISSNSTIFSNVTVCHDVKIGRNSIIHPGAVIGSDGFGNAKDESGQWIKVPQLGGVTIGDNVEVGANTTIDRGTIDDTVIHDNAKIDNLVQIAHNVQVGESTAMAAQVGVAGSTKIGKHCLIGGAAGITGHIEIGDQVMIAAKSGVSKSLLEPGAYASGIPAKPYHQWRKNIARVNRLEKAYAKIRALEKKVELLEKEETN